MGHRFPGAQFLLLTTIASAITSRAHCHTLKSATLSSPELVLAPGSVTNKFHYNVDFPTGHIGIKSFHVEPVDRFGQPIPLHDTYLHHWALNRYKVPINSPSDDDEDNSAARFVRNGGLCQGDILGQYYGSGSETRKTATFLPGPYAIEVGNPEEGYEERWILDIHAIDTRGVVDGVGCRECLCELYNVTNQDAGYKGGLKCCGDGGQCRLEEGFQGHKRSVYLRYTVRWVDWVDGLVLPVKVFIADVTDTGERGMSETVGCQVEYDVKPCSDGDDDWCVYVKRSHFTMPETGYVIYGVAHQHSGAIGSTVYRKDGEVICNSEPIYGTGDEAGNEAGYVVGMTSCYPEPGSLKVTAGEQLILETNYTSTRTRGHVGVMGLFHLFIADQLPPPTMTSSLLHRSLSVFDELRAESWTILALSGLAAVVVVVSFSIWVTRRRETEDGYQIIVA